MPRAVAALVAVTSQTALAAPKEGNGTQADRRQKVLQKFDKNGDGKLSDTERAAAKEARGKRGR